MMRRVLNTLVIMLVLPLAAALSGCDNPVGDDHDELEATGVVITHLDGTEMLATAGDGWVGALPAVQVGGALPVRIFFIAPDGDRFQLPTSGAEHTLAVTFEPADIIMRYEPQGAEQGAFRGIAPGEVHATITIQHGGHPDYESPPLRLEVF